MSNPSAYEGQVKKPRYNLPSLNVTQVTQENIYGVYIGALLGHINDLHERLAKLEAREADND